MSLPPLSVYIHLPWCVRKCPYCDFNSHAGEPSEQLQQRYFDALMQDLNNDLSWVEGRKVSTCFFGGGTPSLFSSKVIGDILSAIDRYIGFEPDAEITLEANPGASEQARFQGYRSAGVNRLSIGVQSFDDGKLIQLGRIHSGAEARHAANIARRAGFENFNLDLMYGLPEQTLIQVQDDLARAVDCGPAHISWYELTIEPNTLFYSKPPTQPDQDLLADYSERGIDYLQSQGFVRYEISAFAKEGQRCLHNLNYWRFGDYLGLGAGAHGKVTVSERQCILRQAKTRQPDHYMDRIGSYIASETEVEGDDIIAEYMMNALRLTDGVDLSEIASRTFQSPTVILEKSEPALGQALLEFDGARLAPTATGLRLLNSCLATFL